MRKKKPSPFGYIKNRDKHLRENYGISIEVYDEMLDEQGHKCAICRAHISRLTGKLHVDHCHVSGYVRGLLCRKCNLGLGCFNDNIRLLARAMVYLEDHGKTLE